VVDAGESNHRAIRVGVIVVSGHLRRTVIRMYEQDGIRMVDLAARVDERYDVQSVSLRELSRRLQSTDSLEPPCRSLLPEITVENEIAADVRQLLIEAAVRAIGSAFFVDGRMACEVLDVCRHIGADGPELRIVVSCQMLDLSADPMSFLNRMEDLAGADQIESIDIEHWVQLMVATDWTMLPMSPGCGEPLSEQETKRYLAEYLDDEEETGA